MLLVWLKEHRLSFKSCDMNRFITQGMKVRIESWLALRYLRIEIHKIASKIIFLNVFFTDTEEEANDKIGRKRNAIPSKNLLIDASSLSEGEGVSSILKINPRSSSLVHQTKFNKQQEMLEIESSGNFFCRLL